MGRGEEEPEHGNGIMKLPVGFRFHPTDEELLLHYLRRKVCASPLPSTVIPEFNVFRSNPWDLPGDSKEKRYFFTKLNMRKFSTECGFWKSTGKGKLVMASGSNTVIGMKKSLVFYQANRVRTQWIMRELCLVCSITAPPYSTQKVMVKMGDWVVCCVYQRKGKPGTKKSMRMMNKLGISSSSSSSCCSGITEVSRTSDLDQEEASS